ncbi:MAG: AMP-binding protein, partial [Chloroflexi bacterium]|nr:AMP-binding protein [Chloroflexota bacterium]
QAVASRLVDCEAKLLVTADGFYRRGNLGPMKETADEAAASAPSIQKLLVVNRTGRDVPWTAGRDVWWHAIVDRQPGAVEPVETDPEEPMMVIYTSGTTGKPKGAVHSHFGFPVKGAQDMAHCFDVGPGDRVLWPTDIGWMMGPWLIGCTLLLGATAVLYDGTPDYPAPDRLWALIERHRPTHFGIAPTAIRSLLRLGEGPVRQHDLSSLRVLGSTGEAWNPAPWRWYFEVVGGGKLPVINYTGGTEVSGGIICGNLLTPIKPCAFAGPVPGMGADVVDEAGRPVRQQVGELVLRTPSVGMTRGFWQDPQRYLDTYWSRWDGVWYHGDFAYIDADGAWYILGRSDDTLKVAGKRVGPAEVESAAGLHEAVLEAAAVGVPDETKGEAIAVLAVLRSGFEPSEGNRQGISDAIARELGKALRPKTVKFVDELPKTRNAKVLRRVARAVLLDQPTGDLSSIENPSAIDAIKRAH